ncbi:virB8 family protein [Variovorax saccharolyticus]|uniref:virB8 family protein n=1 Tax=Variovorax saccharolyticus TaxID=3053516 RepID=UPI00257496ED|nr:type IV secretion system protein [Variovorax sp. J31P216]MDM0029129.1 type IV secretion system protein [Variovorax sp. J31P216]
MTSPNAAADQVATKKAPNRLPQTFVQAAIDFERLKTDELRRSRKVAWMIAGLSTAICAISILAFLVAMLTRTEPEPTILKVDQSTGATEVLRSMRDDHDRFDEVVNKYWIANYVRLYEGYDWYTISEQFEAVKLMSQSDVASQYATKVQADNAPLSVFKDKAKVAAKVTAISFVGELAQVRFTTEKQTTSGDNTDGAPTQKWIATVAFKFENALATEQQRLVNPLGFKVLSYRVDPEVIK